MFSSRLPPSLAPNALMERVQDLRASGATWIDLTETNPTAVGLVYPPHVLDGLANPDGARYMPEALGLRVAREAIASDYARRARPVSPDQLVVTTSTSEAYSLLFKLLCSPGDPVLVPQPSYPLFDLLAGLDGVPLRPYRLRQIDGWAIDRDSLLDVLTPDVRAVLVVSPNNPTGSILRRDDRDWLVELCAHRDIALIVDEVFADYPIRPGASAVSLTGGEPALTFSLGGLSKSAGLPQVKLGWIAVGGPDAKAGEALRRLEIICDTYLSVSTPVQIACPGLIEAGAAVRGAIQARVERNLAALRERLGPHPAVTLLEPEAGWSAVLQAPAVESEESMVLRLLAESRVLVFPGYFFDFPREAFFVTSLLPAPVAFDDGVSRMLEAFGGAPR
jgi:alanine-synthesizing transaminase